MSNASTELQVLVVDDSTLYRKIVRDTLRAFPGVEVVGTARNGLHALEMIKRLAPDVMTLDLEMPELDGIGVLKEIQDRGNQVATIMVSSSTARGAQATNQALREGAFDFVLKPNTSSLEESVEQLRADMGPKIEACRAKIAARRRAAQFHRQPPAARRADGKLPQPITRPEKTVWKPAIRNGRVEIIGIGVSTGGPRALVEILPQLPANLPCPIVIVQHMPPMFTKSLAEDLNRRSALEISEGRTGDVVLPGKVFIAPGGKQMRLIKQQGTIQIDVTDDPPERNCKPSVDYLFRSLAELYGSGTMGVILTGMGNDGTLGAQQIHESGGTLLVQDEGTSVVFGMPRSVIEAGLVEGGIPLSEVARSIVDLTNRGVKV